MVHLTQVCRSSSEGCRAGVGRGCGPPPDPADPAQPRAPPGSPLPGASRTPGPSIPIGVCPSSRRSGLRPDVDRVLRLSHLCRSNGPDPMLGTRGLHEPPLAAASPRRPTADGQDGSRDHGVERSRSLDAPGEARSAPLPRRAERCSALPLVNAGARRLVVSVSGVVPESRAARDRQPATISRLLTWCRRSVHHPQLQATLRHRTI